MGIEDLLLRAVAYIEERLPARLVGVGQTSETSDVRSVAVVRDGHKLVELKPLLDKYLTRPERREGTAKLHDLPSFVGHVKRFASDHSAIFADKSGPRLTAVLDYHQKGSTGLPQNGKHRAVYEFPVSDEWTAWTEGNANEMTQSDFAAFIENRLADLDGGEPGPAACAFREKIGDLEFASPSRLVALSRGLSVREDSRLVNAINLSSGETQLVYETTHTVTADKDGGPITVPGAFCIAIPVFDRTAPYQIPVRLRYRKRGAGVVWFYELYRADAVFDHAFDEACKLVVSGHTGDPATGQSPLEGTSLPLYRGTPE